ncbi:MAG: HAD-IIIC family phosphatase [Sphingobium sp.]
MTLDQHRDFASIVQALRNDEEAVATAADYRRISRALKAVDQGPALRVALMGNMTLDLLSPFLMVETAKLGRIASLHVSPFGQYMQDLRSGDLAAFDPQVILLALSAELMRPAAFGRFHELGLEERHALRDGMVAEMEDWVAAALSRTGASLLVANFPTPASALGLADLTADYGEREFFLDLNLQLLRVMRAYPRVQILDVAQAAAAVGHRRAFDSRMQLLARTNWTEAMMAEVASLFARNVIGALGLARKCLVLDLDNTLWGGVVGEDGPHGVRIGIGDVEGEAFHAFQTRIRALKQRGIILALASKNNPADVEELFSLRGEDMPLRLSDFSARAIGWDAKHAGIRTIAETLNIGLDAIVFIDDNPAEIAQMRSACPDVHCVQLPRDPAAYAGVLDALPWFEKGRVTADDVGKARQYAQAASRAAMLADRDPDAYLRELEMHATIRPATKADLVRIHQMFAKTNQFNLTTQRLSIAQIEALIEDADYHLVLGALRDRFGDLGIVAVYGARVDGDVIRIEHFLMSCRAMGRGLETALVNSVKRLAQAMEGIVELRSVFVPTAKNAPVVTFYVQQGFEKYEDGPPVEYVLDVQNIELLPCEWISMEKRDDSHIGTAPRADRGSY